MKDIGHNDIELSSRQLKAMLYVARYKNLTRAAHKLNRSQTAITKAVSKLEEQLGVKLFDRSSVGMTPNVYGEALAKHIANAEAEMYAAGEAYRQYYSGVCRTGNIPLFTLEISYKRLASFVAIYDTRGIAAAANKLQITRSAIYSSIRQIEELLEINLFERDPSGFTPTSYCHVLARHVKLAFAQFRHGVEDIAKVNGIMSGKVVIGTLPYTRTIITPRAINHLLKQYPQLEVSTREGPYAMQEALLRSGEIDLIIGATRKDAENSGVSTEVLLQDQLALIVREGHPLARKEDLQLSELQDCGWILPAANTPSRKLFDEILSKHKIQQPTHYIESSSLITIRGLLLESDYIALLSEHQIYYDKLYGLLTTLPLDLVDTFRPIGVTTNAQVEPSPAAKLFLESLREVVRDWSKQKS
ncbi:MAG: LysR family transcriptional regulator [Proteobacteria bacterium]|nr:LysR family transcriptional regulator [Pseudomonadota bacterium]